MNGFLYLRNCGLQLWSKRGWKVKKTISNLINWLFTSFISIAERLSIGLCSTYFRIFEIVNLDQKKKNSYEINWQIIRLHYIFLVDKFLDLWLTQIFVDFHLISAMVSAFLQSVVQIIRVRFLLFFRVNLDNIGKTIRLMIDV